MGVGVGVGVGVDSQPCYERQFALFVPSEELPLVRRACHDAGLCAALSASTQAPFGFQPTACSWPYRIPCRRPSIHIRIHHPNRSRQPKASRQCSSVSLQYSQQLASPSLSLPPFKLPSHMTLFPGNVCPEAKSVSAGLLATTHAWPAFPPSPSSTIRSTHRPSPRPLNIQNPKRPSSPFSHSANPLNPQPMPS
jgi:hypothetical protein